MLDTITIYKKVSSMKNTIIKSIIFLLFISFCSAYADTVPDDLYGKWIKLNEKKDGKNCKKLTIKGNTKCYAVHQSISEAYNDIEPDYVWINKKENFFEYRKATADFPENERPIYYKKENDRHLFRVTGETTGGTPYETLYRIEKIDNDYIFFDNPYGSPVELYIREEKAKSLKIPVITFDYPVD